MLQAALTQKKISGASGKLSKGLTAWVLQMLLRKAACVALVAWQTPSAEEQPEPLL